MNFLFGFFGVICGFLLLFVVLALLIRHALKKYGFRQNSLRALYQESKRIYEEDKKKPKQVSGMTEILLPEIRRDFPDFEIETFYKEIEKTTLALLDSISKKDLLPLQKTKQYHLFLDEMKFYLDDLITKEEDYTFSNVLFHKHAIKSYHKKKEAAVLEIATSFQCDYEVKKENKVIKEEKEKQLRIRSTFVYIVDSKKAGFSDLRLLGLHCPNCGASITSLQDTKCSYCKSKLNLQIADLAKCFKIIKIKKDS